MTIYNIRTTSWPIWILTLIASMVVGILLMSTMGVKSMPAEFACMLIILFASFYLQKYTSRGEVQFSISNSNIQIKYLKQPVFSKKIDQTILLNDVESYKYQPDRNFDLFKLTLKNQTELYFYHYSGFAGDDFEKLVIDFPKFVLDYNRHKKSDSSVSTLEKTYTEPGIKREKTLFEGKTGLLLAGLAIIFIVMFSYLMITKQMKGSSGGFGLLASISGAIFFLGQYFKYRNKND